MELRCDRCGSKPVIFVRYSGRHLCGEHFLELLKRRVKHQIRDQGLFRTKGRIGVAVSGGKDSVLLLSLLTEILGPVRDLELVAITIDEGIEGYRPSSVEIARSEAERVDMEWRCISFKELYSLSLNDMMGRTDLGPCTVCGILRRKALNILAKRNECSVLVTGHNLDDMAQTVLMNVMSADLSRLVRMGPHLDPVAGFVPRAMPLRNTPETETYLAALLMGLPIHDRECPYSTEAHRGLFRDILLMAEDQTPGTRHSLLRFHEHISPLIPRVSIDVGVCTRCGEAVVNGEGEGFCKACSLEEGFRRAYDEEEKG